MKQDYQETFKEMHNPKVRGNVLAVMGKIAERHRNGLMYLARKSGDYYCDYPGCFFAAPGLYTENGRKVYLCDDHIPG